MLDYFLESIYPVLKKKNSDMLQIINLQHYTEIIKNLIKFMEES